MGEDGITNCDNAQNCVKSLSPMNIPLTKAIYVGTERRFFMGCLAGWRDRASIRALAKPLQLLYPWPFLLLKTQPAVLKCARY